MPYPNLTGKHAYDSLITPQDLHASLQAEGAFPDLSAVRGAIICYQARIMDQIAASENATRVRGVGGGNCSRRCWPERCPDRAVFGRFGIGAPVAAVVLEDLIAFGIRSVVGAGTAGCLQRGMAVGDLVVCTGAIRDEGVSYHYIEADAPALPDAAMTDRLGAALAAEVAETCLHAGPSWTIDAPYRETVEKDQRCQAMGVQTVEM